MKILESIIDLSYLMIRRKPREYKDMEKYRIKIKESGRDSVVEAMALDYFAMDVKQRYLLEYKLKDRMNDMDKVSFLSLAFIFLVPAITNLFKDTPGYMVILYLILYIYIAAFIMNITTYYRLFKLYVEIIASIKNKEIIEVEVQTTVKKIEFVDKLREDNLEG